MATLMKYFFVLHDYLLFFARHFVYLHILARDATSRAAFMSPPPPPAPPHPPSVTLLSFSGTCA